MTHPFLILQWLEQQLHVHVGEHVTTPGWYADSDRCGFSGIQAIALVPTGAQT